MNEMVERYIYAVALRLPYKMREDVKRELAGIIQDMLDERCGDIPPTEHDIRVVLTELGAPDELAKKYQPDSRGYLIGPKYYYEYKKVMLIVLAATALGMAIATGISAFAKPWYMVIFDAFSMFLGGAIYIFAFVTAIFAFFEKRNIKFSTGGTGLDDLPQIPDRSGHISRAECLGGIVICAVFTAIFLFIPGIFGLYIDGNEWLGIFNVSVIRSRWAIVLAFASLDIFKEYFKLREGRYTRRLAIVCAAINLLSIPLAVLLTGDGRIINSDFISAMRGMFPGDGGIVAILLERPDTLMPALIIFALLLDMGVVIRQSLRNQKTPGSLAGAESP